MQRETKKRETRQRISDVATKLFVTRGFDAVTLDEVAAAAKVSKMTVFNYFARKEDLMLDRLDDIWLVPFREALRARPEGERPIAAIRRLLAGMKAKKQTFVRIHPRSNDWWRAIMASTSLQARLHELEDQAAVGLVPELGKDTGLVRLLAATIVLTVRIAREDAIRVLDRGGSSAKASAAFMRLLHRGLEAAEVLDLDHSA